MRIKLKSFSFIANLIVVALLLLLPYWIFEGRLYLGGDDTHLFYIYPNLFIENISSSAWFNFSSVGSYNPNFFILPFLYIVSIFHLILRSDMIQGYIFFSLPLIGGYLYMRRLLEELIETSKHRIPIATTGAIIYITSPIMVIGLLVSFLYAAWLMALIPAIFYYLVRYQKTGNFKYPVYAALLSIILSQAWFSIPWALGVFIPVFPAYLYFLLSSPRSTRATGILRTVKFGSVILGSQAFWLLPFSYSFLGSNSSDFGSKILSSETSNTFLATVMATATGSVIYPLTNLFFRQIAFDFHWELSKVFESLYDKTIFLNLIFPAILIAGAILVLNKRKKGEVDGRLYVAVMIALLLSLFLFTVNIGLFRELFIFLGNLPGFAMFRNGFDKFAFGYIFVFSIAISLALSRVLARTDLAQNSVIRRYSKVILVSIVLSLSAVNFYPVKQLVDRPLWTTNNISTSTDMPVEYREFMTDLKKAVPETSSLLSLPYGSSSYSIIPGTTTNQVYAGRSPVQIFSGRNDFSGSLSFPSSTALKLEKYIVGHDFARLENFFESYNIRYAIVAKNIPPEVRNSYLFNQSVLAAQNADFLTGISDGRILTSSDGNYELYRLKTTSSKQAGILSASGDYYSVEDKALSTDSRLNLVDDLQLLINDEHPFVQAPQRLDGSRGIFKIDNAASQSIRAGKYRVLQSSPDVGRLKFDMNRGALTLGTGAHIYDGNIDIGNAKTAYLAPFGPEQAVEINGKFIDSQALASEGYVIGRNDKSSIYKYTGVELENNQSDFGGEWKREDCNSRDRSNSVSFEDTAQGLKLSAKSGHNACAWKSYDLDTNSVYRIEFDYSADTQDLAAALTDSSGEKLETLPLVYAGDGQVRHFSGFYRGDTATGTEKLYLYSGNNVSGSTAIYKNIRITQYLSQGRFDYQSRLSQVEPSASVGVKSETKLSVPSEFADLPDKEISFESWSQSDCNAIDTNSGKTEFSATSDNSVTLGGSDLHNACIYRTFDINPNEVYQLSFDQVGGKSRRNLYISYGPTRTPEVIPLDEKGHLAHRIIPPVGATEMTMYLYSGVAKKGRAAAEYSNLKLSHAPKSSNGLYLVEEPRPGEQNLSVESKKMAAHFYTAELRGALGRSVFMLNDSFNPGWSLRVARASGGGGVIDEHFQVNGHGNGWYIDTDKLCREQNLCEQNADGSYNIQLVAEFKPQRWFYVGLIISGVTFAGLVGYLAWTRVRSRRKVAEEHRS